MDALEHDLAELKLSGPVAGEWRMVSASHNAFSRVSGLGMQPSWRR